MMNNEELAVVIIIGMTVCLYLLAKFLLWLNPDVR